MALVLTDDDDVRVPALTAEDGCGQPVKGRRVFVDKTHQLRWMVAGGAAELNAMQPLDAKARGGTTAGRRSADSGQLLEASKKGAEKARAIARTIRGKPPGEE